MKKLLILGAVLALLAVLVVPMAALAADVNVNGEVPAVASILTMTTPTNIVYWSTTPWLNNTGYIVVGTNYAQATSGSMVYTQGNDGFTGWGITVAVNGGYINPGSGYAQMYGPDWLPTPIQLSKDGSNFYQFAAATQFTYSGTTDGTTPLDLYAEQVVNTTDAPGVYGLVIVYTMTPTT